MDGLYISGRRPATKKAVKDAVAANPTTVVVESTSMFGGKSGPLPTLGDGVFQFVGPDPYTNRKFYGTITIANGKVTVK